MNTSTATFNVGSLPISGDLLLAPMDGISDIPFRSICRRYGSAISYTPFIRAGDLLQNSPTAWQTLQFLPSERPVAFQLYDEGEAHLVEATEKILHLQPDMIDINMGCPIRKISNRGAGAGMLRDPEKIARVIRALSNISSVPITAKIRLGWDENERNYLEVCHAIEENGGALIAVHARTRSQGYRTPAEWGAIAEIKQAVNIPVLGNGDVDTVLDIHNMLSQTGCDGIMIGRGAIGHPWIFERIDRGDVSQDEVIRMIDEHLGSMMRYYGAERGSLLFRKHLKGYLEHFDLDQELQETLITCEDRETILRTLHRAAREIA
jgi:tRNA-dihydrouridine synthase B